VAQAVPELRKNLCSGCNIVSDPFCAVQYTIRSPPAVVVFDWRTSTMTLRVEETVATIESQSGE
jgi:hypothetical protein